MANQANDKEKKYAHYAAHCSYLFRAATDPDSRAIQSEMVAEWLKLADAMRQPSPIEEKIGHDLGEGDAGVVVDGDMGELPAEPFAA
jgi:hypothetical protein